MPEERVSRLPIPPKPLVGREREVAAVAERARAALESNGTRCWIAPRDVPPGTPYGAALVQAMAASRLMVLVYSAAANTSPQVRRKVERAGSKDVPILPFRIEDAPMAEALEYFLSESHWLTAGNPPSEPHLDALVQAMHRLLARSNAP